MHLADGILPMPTLAVGFAAAAAGIAFNLRSLKSDDMPRIAVMTAAFFVASWIHVGRGPISVHLLLHGLVGIVLGTQALLAIGLGLLLQAIQFAHGGVSTWGVNTCLMGYPAVLVGMLFCTLGKGRSPRTRTILAAVLAVLATALSALLAALALITGGESFRTVAGTLLIAHIPVLYVEAAVAASVVAFLQKVKPEVIP